MADQDKRHKVDLSPSVHAHVWNLLWKRMEQPIYGTGEYPIGYNAADLTFEAEARKVLAKNGYPLAMNGNTDIVAIAAGVANQLIFIQER